MHVLLVTNGILELVLLFEKLLITLLQFPQLCMVIVTPE